jgi:hypothetical protein
VGWSGTISTTRPVLSRQLGHGLGISDPSTGVTVSAQDGQT